MFLEKLFLSDIEFPLSSSKIVYIMFSKFKFYHYQNYGTFTMEYYLVFGNIILLHLPWAYNKSPINDKNRHWSTQFIISCINDTNNNINSKNK